MKKKTETLIQEKLIKLLDNYKIDEIDISMICDSLKIKRQTFYYHYKNIYDVIYSIYYEKQIKFKKSTDFNSILKDAITFLFNEEYLSREVLTSNAKDVLSEFLYSSLYKEINLYLKKFKLTLDQRRKESVFISKSVSEYILYLFKNEELTCDDIIKEVDNFINEDIVLDITKNYIIRFKYEK